MPKKKLFVCLLAALILGLIDTTLKESLSLSAVFARLIGVRTSAHFDIATSSPMVLGEQSLYCKAYLKDTLKAIDPFRWKMEQDYDVSDDSEQLIIDALLQYVNLQDERHSSVSIPVEVNHASTLIVSEVGDLFKFQLELLTMLYPSWQRLAVEAAQGLQPVKVVLDIALFVERPSLPVVPSRCEKPNLRKCERLAARRCKVSSSTNRTFTTPACWAISLRKDYSVDRASFNGYAFQTTYAYLASDEFVQLAKAYDFILRIDIDSVLAPGALWWTPPSDGFAVGASYSGSNITWKILRSLWRARSVHKGKHADIFGVSKAGCCPPMSPSMACPNAKTGTCSKSSDDFVVFNQDAVYFPSSSSAEFGPRWASLSQQLYDEWSDDECNRFTSEACEWPHWHRDMAAVYALTLILSDEAIAPRAKKRRTRSGPAVQLSTRLDVEFDRAINLSLAVHLSMMSAKRVWIDWLFAQEHRNEVCCRASHKATSKQWFRLLFMRMHKDRDDFLSTAGVEELRQTLQSNELASTVEELLDNIDKAGLANYVASFAWDSVQAYCRASIKDLKPT